MMEEDKKVFPDHREYVFTVYDGSGEKKVRKKETELTKSDRDLLLGELIKTWDITPESEKFNFVDRLIRFGWVKVEIKSTKI